VRVYQPLFFGIFDDCLFSPVLSHLVTYSAKPPYPLPSLRDLDILLSPYPISSTNSELTKISTPNLSLSEFIRTKGVFPSDQPLCTPVPS